MTTIVQDCWKGAPVKGSDRPCFIICSDRDPHQLLNVNASQVLKIEL